jgi:1-deoxy-D-xylulose-5-phosphate reductoisomerase
VKPISVVILGATGSIGLQAIDVIRRSEGRLRLVGVGAGAGRLTTLQELATEFGVEVVGVDAPENDSAATATGLSWPAGAKVFIGPSANEALAAHPCDVVLNAIAGAAGLRATVAALKAGNRLALANKESLVVGAPVVMPLAARDQIIPVDSEHSALAQCLRAGELGQVRKLVLTASGGPFRGYTREQLSRVTPKDALAHPTWQMGPLVTINSATLMNKGLELIEAHLLFGLPMNQLDVVVHPQSIVHSMVEFVDGSTVAQASPPDMRLPIAHALLWPNRLPNAAPALDWSASTQWLFEPVDEEVFGALRLARQAGGHGGLAPAVLNGANEAAVAAFLAGRIGFLEITDIVTEVVSATTAKDKKTDVQGAKSTFTLDDVVKADLDARSSAEVLIAKAGS